MHRVITTLGQWPALTQLFSAGVFRVALQGAQWVSISAAHDPLYFLVGYAWPLGVNGVHCRLHRLTLPRPFGASLTAFGRGLDRLLTAHSVGVIHPCVAQPLRVQHPQDRH